MTGRILITGGAGCIGSELAAALVADGEDVVVLDNLSSGRLEHTAALASKPNFHFVEGDLLTPGIVEAALDGVDMVYHLAANPEVKFTAGDPTDRDLRQNVLATYNLLEAMRTRGVKRLAFASTSAVYGIAQTLPIAETGLTVRPVSLYGATKLACEALVSSFQHLFEMQCWIFRFANVVGAKWRRTGRTVITDFIWKLRRDPQRLEVLGNGRQAKSYLLTGECVEGMRYGVKHARGRFNLFNLGPEDSVTVTRIAEIVAQEMGLEDIEYHYGVSEGGWPGDVPRYLLDVRAIHSLGWRAQHSSEQAVRIATVAALASVNEFSQGGQEQSCKP